MYNNMPDSLTLYPHHHCLYGFCSHHHCLHHHVSRSSDPRCSIYHLLLVGVEGEVWLSPQRIATWILSFSFVVAWCRLFIVRGRHLVVVSRSWKITMRSNGITWCWRCYVTEYLDDTSRFFFDFPFSFFFFFAVFLDVSTLKNYACVILLTYLYMCLNIILHVHVTAQTFSTLFALWFFCVVDLANILLYCSVGAVSSCKVQPASPPLLP